jgi:hypothetical protein
MAEAYMLAVPLPIPKIGLDYSILLPPSLSPGMA